MIASAAQGSIEPIDVLGEFENWLLDLVLLDGVYQTVGYSQWHDTPVDRWVQSRKFSWLWADTHPVIHEYRRLAEAIHNSTSLPITVYEALAVLRLLKTLIRYRLAYPES